MQISAFLQKDHCKASDHGNVAEYGVSMETWLTPVYHPISANIKKCRSRAAFPYICGRKMSHSFAGRNEVLSMHGTDAPLSNRPINNRPPLLA